VERDAGAGNRRWPRRHRLAEPRDGPNRSLSWKCSSERSATKNHAGRVGWALRRAARGGAVGARLRRTAAPPRGRRRCAIVETADGQFGRCAAAVELSALRRRPPASLRGRRQETRRDHEGSRHRSGHGVLVRQPRGVLSRRRVVAPVSVGRRRRAAGDRRFAGHRRFVLPGPRVARRVRGPRSLPDSRAVDVPALGPPATIFRRLPSGWSRSAFRSSGGRFPIVARPTRTKRRSNFPADSGRRPLKSLW